ncbi:uncharacterized protein [Nicotiana tomentosiformis]|uniref:uncharacterized protein n=1 Tax=Nicotiana tomentosiformis TaxID=4098 RepID=UPI00388C8F52
MAYGWKRKINLLALEKETAKAKLVSVEVQLWVAKEKADKWSQLNDDLRGQLSSVVTERDALGREYEAVKSKLATTSANADEVVAQYKADVEATEVRLKAMTEYMKRLSRREKLKEIHTQGFDLSAEIEEARKSEVEAKKLYEPDGSEGLEGSDGSGEESNPGED